MEYLMCNLKTQLDDDANDNYNNNDDNDDNDFIENCKHKKLYLLYHVCCYKILTIVNELSNKYDTCITVYFFFQFSRCFLIFI